VCSPTTRPYIFINVNEDENVPRPSRVLARLGAGIALTAEALAAAVVGGAYVVFGLASESAHTAFSLSVAALALALALGLGAATWGVWHGRRWAASLSVTWQVIQGAVGVYVFSEHPFVGLTVIALAALAIAGTLRSSGARAG